MKHTRLYSALPRVHPRVRSNSVSSSRTLTLAASFFDAPPPPGPAPPPPNTRLTTHRLPIDARGEVEGPNNAAHAQAPLALVAPHTPSNNHPHPAQLALLFPYTPHTGAAQPASGAPAAGGARTSRRRGQRYTLDVGAYGIPKRGHGQRVRGLHAAFVERTDAPLAVQVGEDAYFVRENAMGVADGVGGWARVKHAAPPTGPSASALFARRLMHFCADEVDRASHPQASTSTSTSTSKTQPPPQPQPWRTPAAYSRFAPYPMPSSASSFTPTSLPTSTATSFAPWHDPLYDNPWRDDNDAKDPEDLLRAELDELADGMDVLRILERAYERTLGAHVVPVPVPVPVSPLSVASASARKRKEKEKEKREEGNGKAGSGPKTIPLLAGSSTALVAVLDYVPRGEVDVEFEVSMKDKHEQTQEGEQGKEHEEEELTPVLKIAHVGDCMGMLVREGAVAWRSEEMWWRWNTPVQLSAVSSSHNTKPLPTPTPTPQQAGWWGSWHTPNSTPQANPNPSPKQGGGGGVQQEVTPASAAHLFTLPVRAGDVVILASDGLSDNLWDEDVLEEVGRVGRAWDASAAAFEVPEEDGDLDVVGEGDSVDSGRLRRQTLAGMLSEALCSRARRVATRRGAGREGRRCGGGVGVGAGAASPTGSAGASEDEEDTPFARRARETGRVYRGGKNDDISVIVAVIAPAEEHGHGHGRRRVEAGS
ncbi:hypothetical protein C8R46DRAFT_1082999 [Mycena filopes]|nr:hypothetical protein C8R46DRAFT_1082999 [Mycena filopes]